MDKTIAKNCPLVDAVIGGHTNTFLYTGEQPDFEKIDGPYPTIITQVSGKQVPVVQAYAYTKYLGELRLTVNVHNIFFEFHRSIKIVHFHMKKKQTFAV